MRSLLNNKTFNLFFEWFYPQYLTGVVETTLNAFYQDDEVVHLCLKMLGELVNNRNNRVRFDMWNINGLVVFKECAKYTCKLLQLWDSLKTKESHRDCYQQKWKYVKEISQLYMNVINGNYINFAICEYYNDDCFTQLTLLVMAMVTQLDHRELKSYAKVQGVVYNMLWSFLAKHLELIFMKFSSK